MTRRTALLSAASAALAQLAPRRRVQAISASAYCPSGVEEELFQQLNAYRRQRGESPLKLDRGLGAAARHHANDMAAKGYFSHTSQNGDSPGDRARDHGYGSGYIGENIAKGQRDVSSVMSSWKNSSGHNTNMLRSSYKAVGLGYDPDGRYWVQLFGGTYEAAPTCGAPDPGPGPDPDPRPKPRNRCASKKGKARKRCVRRRRRSS